MKPLLILFLTTIILSSCDKNKSITKQTVIQKQTEKKIQSNKINDTIHNFWALNRDTISSQTKFKVSNLYHTLKIITYSLNDSSIVRNLAKKGERPYLDHSHKVVTDLKFLTDSVIDTKQIDKTLFKNILVPEFYSECNLYSTHLDSISDKYVYLNSNLAVPDSDNMWRVWYSIKIVSKKLGTINMMESDYVGL